jgi:signal transduction histidine kinase
VFNSLSARAQKLSLVSRTLWLTLFAVLLAQSVTSVIWYQHSKQKNLEGIEATSSNMASMFASTVTFFQSLPVEYRHIVLDQIRNMGGSRFFVSFNNEFLDMDAVSDSEFKSVAVRSVNQVLDGKLFKVNRTHVEFVAPANLKILKNDIYLDELPRSWAHHTLTLPPIEPPILVVQIEVEPDKWLYIAAILPAPYMLLGADLFGFQQFLFLAISTSLLLLLTFLMIRRQVKPLKRLAKAANNMSLDSNRLILKEEGASELVTATKAFNRMQQRIRIYIDDRESLFSSISHDLKTPITRLRLRTELLESDIKRAKFNQDLDELEMMVKGALQCVRETDLHENVEPVDLQSVFESIVEPFNQTQLTVRLPKFVFPEVYARPLAIKRALSNLIENGVKYGGQVTIFGTIHKSGVLFCVSDNGPGIVKDQLERVFEPYVRLASDDHGHGLGLGISRNIFHAHGGDLILHNRKSGGISALAYMEKGSAQPM